MCGPTRHGRLALRVPASPPPGAGAQCASAWAEAGACPDPTAREVWEAGEVRFASRPLVKPTAAAWEVGKLGKDKKLGIRAGS